MIKWAKNIWDSSPKWLLVLFTAILTTTILKIKKGQLFWPIIAIIILVFALFVFIVLYFKTKKYIQITQRKDKKEFISRFGVKWLINYNKKTIDNRPYCTCCREPRQMKYFPQTYGFGAHFSCDVGNSIRELMNEDCKKFDLKEALEFVKKELKF
ncbi:MAG: hypothetical protein A2539_04135 [Elusimicrobia bacterium RIFOXYD2_FULL_34_15]|nr:MAG: hypothetical protein A2539_04135 [Elusimicrobia bacterium RIFOXYD2_FULL_34_15]